MTAPHGALACRTLAALAVAATLLLAACGHSPPQQAAAPASAVLAPAQKIVVGGPIVTVGDAQPTAEAVAVRDGRIVAVGSRAEVMGMRGPSTEVVDLQGRTLVPGLIDGHAHIAQFGTLAIGANLLAGPDGRVETIDDLVAEMKKALASQDQSLTGWVFGMGYDDAILGRHPNRDDLDRVSTTVPVLVIHISGHFSAVNSVGLKKIGYTAATPDPEGGVIRRRAGSKEPDGVMEEVAHFAFAVNAVAPKSPAASDLFLKKGLALAKSFGYTTANEGMTFPPQDAGFVDAAKRGLFDEGYRKKWPTHVHANGDAAIDQFIAALKPVQAKYGPGDRRNVLIHGQFVRQDQLDALKELQVIPSLFPMHTFYWGDWYGKIIGPELAAQISPMRSAIKRGMMPTSHTDAPVALPNLMQVMWAKVNRSTRSGMVQGPDERISPMEALKAITPRGAYEQFEEKSKRSIEVGKLADLVILSDNPLTIDPMKINKIQVMETIKEGRTVFKC